MLEGLVLICLASYTANGSVQDTSVWGPVHVGQTVVLPSSVTLLVESIVLLKDIQDNNRSRFQGFQNKCFILVTP